jgi:hypothetical protein
MDSTASRSDPFIIGGPCRQQAESRPARARDSTAEETESRRIHPTTGLARLPGPAAGRQATCASCLLPPWASALAAALPASLARLWAARAGLRARQAAACMRARTATAGRVRHMHARASGAQGPGTGREGKGPDCRSSRPASRVHAQGGRGAGSMRSPVVRLVGAPARSSSPRNLIMQ